MDRSELIFIGLGGAGGRLVDSIVEINPMFQSFYINTSMTDLESLDSFNDVTKNYFCISTQNGVGRNRELGKEFAKQYGYNIIDRILKFQQDTIYLVSSLGGGSGSSILSVLLSALEDIKEDGGFNKTINLIGILPDLKSSDVILRNAEESWKEIITNKAITSMIFVDNNSLLYSIPTANERELAINEKFATTFDSIFDIPEVNGINFDNGNLSNILKDKGCLYFYNLPSDCTSIEVAMSKAEKLGVLPKMFITPKNSVELNDGTKAIKCGYLGISFNNENYKKEYVSKHYKAIKEQYVGYNEDTNLILISGCLPPFNAIKSIEYELQDREKSKETNELDYSAYMTGFKIEREENEIDAKRDVVETVVKRKGNQIVKKAMKKNLFKK